MVGVSFFFFLVLKERCMTETLTKLQLGCYLKTFPSLYFHNSFNNSLQLRKKIVNE